MEICHALKIDDPVYWMNNVPPQIVDLWIAHYIVKNSDTKTMRDPVSVFDEIFEGI